MKTANHTYYLASGAKSLNSIRIANALAIELIPYGIELSDELFDRITQSSNEVALEFSKDILAEYTIGKVNPPLFKDWEKRTYFSYDEFIVQIFGYIVQLSGNDLENPRYMQKLLKKVKFKKIKTLELASKEAAKEKFLDLVNVQVSQDKKGQETLRKAALHFADLVDDVYIKSDEARVAVLMALSTKKTVAKHLANLKCKPADVLRYAAAKKNFDGVKLPSDVIYGNLTWQERVTLISHLNGLSFDDLCESMGNNRECWFRFFKHVHLFNQRDFINRFPNLSLAARISVSTKVSEIPLSLRKTFNSLVKDNVIEVLDSNNTVYRTFASRVDTAVNNQDFAAIQKFFAKKNGGYLLRNLAHIGNGVIKKFEGDFVNLVRGKLAHANPGVLFSILGINVDAKYRIIDAKGNTTVTEANYPQVIKDIQGDIRREIHRRWGYEGKVKVSEALKNCVVPFLSKNADLDRGTKISFEDTNYLYFLCHWVQKSNKRTDLDTSYICFDDNWNSETVYFGNQANAFITHSGDITNAPAPNGATEYGRINLKNIRKGVRYITPIINVYAGSPLSENQEAYAGFMFSNDSEFSIQRKHVRYNLTQPANCNIPFVIDVKKKEIMILDFNNRVCGGLTAHSEISNVKKLISAAEDKYVITIGMLGEILSGDSEKVSLKIRKSPEGDGEIDPDSLSKLFV